MIKQKLLGLCALLLVSQFLGCGKDDESKMSMSITLDGESQSIKTLSSVLAFETQGTHEGRAIQFVGQANGNLFTMTISNWDFQNPPENGILAKTYYDLEAETLIDKGDCLEEGQVMLCDGYLITYTTGNVSYYSAFDEDFEGTLTITKSDSKNKKISGEFSCRVATGDEEDDLLTLTGKFQNIAYMVLN